jgi:hypothetical protein
MNTNRFTQRSIDAISYASQDHWGPALETLPRVGAV